MSKAPPTTIRRSAIAGALSFAVLIAGASAAFAARRHQFEPGRALREPAQFEKQFLAQRVALEQTVGSPLPN